MGRKSWTKYDEKYWNKGEFDCPLFSESGEFTEDKEFDGIDPKKGPPDNCPYSLEHLMRTQNAERTT